jgi:Reeler domain
MPSHYGRKFWIKSATVLAAILVAVVGYTGFLPSVNGVEASASGPTPAHTSAPGENNCTECHTSFPVNSGTGSVVISGLPARYAPGQHIPVTVTVSQSDAVLYGFQFTALDLFGRPAGTFTLPAQTPPKLQTVTGIVNNVQRTYVEHTNDGIIPTQFGSLSWTFTWNAPNQDIGTVKFYAAGNAANSDGSPGGDFIYTTSKTLLSRGTVPKFDFDGDGRTDVGIFRPPVGEWWYLRSSDGQVPAAQFGTSTDVPVPADFTGDGKTDIAFFRPSTGQWFVLRSENGSFFAFPFGTTGDIPCPADFDGDGIADPAVFRPSSSTWFILRSGDGGVSFIQFGISTDLPVPADYDGDGKADIGVWRRGPGEWWIQRSTAGLMALQFGTSTDKAVVGDYTADGKADVAFWRPSNGFWFVLRSEDGSFFSFPFGQAGDVPAQGDYDGDGKTDPAVFRQPGSQWFALQTTSGFFAVGFGSAGDQPLPGVFDR